MNISRLLIGAILQARMGSSRLPGKVMMPIDDKNPVLYYVIRQVQCSKLLDKIVIATTDLKDDDVIFNFAHNNGVDCFRGSSEDVLDRYYKCAKKFSFSVIVRITCDNPLIDPTLIDQAINEFNSGSYDYVSNALQRTFPFGTEVEVFTFKALEIAWGEAKKSYEREHVTSYFYNNPDRFRIYNLSNHEDISHLRWTVDRLNDLRFVRVIISKIKKRPILTKDILRLLSKEPDLMKINEDCSENI